MRLVFAHQPGKSPKVHEEMAFTEEIRAITARQRQEDLALATNGPRLQDSPAAQEAWQQKVRAAQEAFQRKYSRNVVKPPSRQSSRIASGLHPGWLVLAWRPLIHFFLDAG